MAQTFYQWLENKAKNEPERYDELFGWLWKLMGKGAKAIKNAPGAAGALTHWGTTNRPADQLGRSAGNYNIYDNPYYNRRQTSPTTALKTAK